MKVYKVLGENGEPVNGGHGKWSLPNRGKPGKWMPKIEGELVPCDNGYHLCRRDDLITWLGPTIYEAEYRGSAVNGGNKVVVREARLLRRLSWDDRIARLFSCDCAEWALSLVEKPDPRSLEVVRVGRLFAIGKATQEELNAARAAARDAARAAAREYIRDRLFEYLEGRA